MYCETYADKLISKFQDEKLHWYINSYEIEFDAYPADVMKAGYLFNEIFNTCGMATVYDYVSRLGIDESSISVPLDENHPLMQFTFCMESAFADWGNGWIPIIYDVIEEDDRLVFTITLCGTACADQDHCDKCEYNYYGGTK